jgi:hypothetical protein
VLGNPSTRLITAPICRGQLGNHLYDYLYEDTNSCVGPAKDAGVSFNMFGSRLNHTIVCSTACADARPGATACYCCCRRHVGFKASSRAWMETCSTHRAPTRCAALLTHMLGIVTRACWMQRTCQDSVSPTAWQGCGLWQSPASTCSPSLCSTCSRAPSLS